MYRKTLMEVIVNLIEKQACYGKITKDALSMKRKDVVDKLEGSLRMQFYRHCAKIILYPNNSLVEHWVKEMTAFIDWVQYVILKPSNAKIDKNLLRNTFFNLCDSNGTFVSLLKNVESGYEKSNIDKEDEKLYQKFWQFVDEIIDNIVNGKLNVSTMQNLVNQYLRTK